MLSKCIPRLCKTQQTSQNPYRIVKKLSHILSDNMPRGKNIKSRDSTEQSTENELRLFVCYLTTSVSYLTPHSSQLPVLITQIYGVLLSGSSDVLTHLPKGTSTYAATCDISIPMSGLAMTLSLAGIRVSRYSFDISYQTD